MAGRRYYRDKLGRFASKGGVVKSPIAAQTRVAGKYQQAIKANDGDWEVKNLKLPVRAVAPTRSPRRVSGRIANLYRGDVAGLRQDMRQMYEMAKDTGQSRRRTRRKMKWSSLL